MLSYGRMSFGGAKITPSAISFKQVREEKIDISGIDFSNITSLKQMFYMASNLTTIKGLEKLDVSNMTDFTDCFRETKLSGDIDLSNWDTSKVTTMQSMFHGADITSVNTTGWDTSKVIRFDSLFRFCYKITELDLSHFDFSSISQARDNAYGYMFKDCIKLKKLNLSSFTGKTTYNNYWGLGVSMLDGCSSLEELDLTGLDSPNSKGTNSMKAIPTNCHIKVSSQDIKDYILGIRSDFTNIEIVGGE